MSRPKKVIDINSPDKNVRETVKKTPEVKLVKYTIGATIQTGPYSNIRPEITVEAETLNQAEEFVFPYIEHLFNTFLNFTERANPMQEEYTTPNNDIEEKTDDPQTEIVLSEAYNKALNTLNNCTSIESVNMVVQAIDKSVKLNVDEKKILLNQSAKKLEEINSNGTNQSRPS